MMTPKNNLTFVFCFFAIFFSACSSSQVTILNSLEERDANVIVVFLESKGIVSNKVQAAASGAGGGENAAPKFSIQVRSERSVEAMAILNQNGLPQRQGTTLLELFSKGGFMTSEKENEIRYQAGLAQQLSNVILKIDGVIEAEVQLSIPDSTADEEIQSTKVTTAAVFVKHQGVFDDPNSHLTLKIKKLIAGSVQDLSFDNVTVISDKSRFTDVSPVESLKESQKAKAADQVKIWSITMNKDSTTKFRIFFFLLTAAIILLALLLGFVIWKVYPVIKEFGGFGKVLNPIPYLSKNKKQALPSSGLMEQHQEDPLDANDHLTNQDELPPSEPFEE